MTAIKEPAALKSGPEIQLHLTGSKGRAQRCNLLGIEQSEMHVRSDQWIEPKTRISVVFADLTFAGEVLYCLRKDSWYRISIGLLFGVEQRRSEPRLAVNRPATVIALSNDSRQTSTPGTLRDLAVAGMRIEMPDHVETGTTIYLETGSEILAGEVRRCVKLPNGQFETGVEISAILPGKRLLQETRGTLKNLRKKLAQAILGESITKTEARNVRHHGKKK